MARALPALTIRDDVLLLRIDDPIEDPALRRVAGCIRGLTAFVECAAQRHGAGAVMASLIVVAANMALQHGAGRVVADALRQNAAMLELEGGKDAP